MNYKHTKLHETIIVDDKAYCLDCEMLRDIKNINKVKISFQHVHSNLFPQLYSERQRQVIEVLYRQAI